MIADATNLLGLGLYSPSEAAFYARIPTQTLTRWIFGSGTSQAVVDRQVSVSDDKIVTFLDFVQALAIRAIRIRHRIPLQTIRQAHDDAVKYYNVPYPFARPHQVFLLPETKTLIIKLNDDDLRALSGRTRGNKMIVQIVEPFLRDVSFDESQLAAKYIAWSNQDGVITMNPQYRFGEPIIDDCGYTAQALWQAYETEGGVEAAAKAYGVEDKHVLLACEYYDHLVGTSAAAA
jgi:uncharacterized protein (DUF433 family)